MQFAGLMNLDHLCHLTEKNSSKKPNLFNCTLNNHKMQLINKADVISTAGLPSVQYQHPDGV